MSKPKYNPITSKRKEFRIKLVVVLRRTLATLQTTFTRQTLLVSSTIVRMELYISNYKGIHWNMQV